MMAETVPRSTTLAGALPSDGAAPVVTVIVATYNRSNMPDADRILYSFASGARPNSEDPGRL